MAIAWTKKGLIALVVAGVLTAASAQAAYVQTKRGKTIKGSSIRSKSNGDVILMTANGPLTFTKGSYVKAVADEPKAYRQAQQLASSGKYDPAIKLLKEVIAKYHYLQWDNRARATLADIYARQGNNDAARKAYEELFRASPGSKKDSDIMWGYRGILLSSKKYAALETELDKIIKTGDREDAARAQIMRGDIRQAQGQTEPAVMDYMRTMVFFKDVSDYQPEAMFKAAAGMEAMRNEQGAKKIYRDLVEKYPASPYAGQAKGKL